MPRKRLPAKGIGVKLRQARNERNLSLRELAEAISVTQSYISKLETGGVKEPSGGCLIRLASYFGWTIEELREYFVSAEEEKNDQQIKQLEQKLADVPEINIFIEASKPLVRSTDFSTKKLYLGLLESFQGSRKTTP